MSLIIIETLALRQIDESLGPWRALPRARPQGGWLRAVRGALGMTTRQVANTVGVTQAAVVDAERNEAKGDITLTTLQRYAAALGCEVSYVLVPERPLQQMVEERADWLFGRRRGDPLDPRFIHTVLRRMFDQTWEWAGRDRRPLSSSSGFHPRISERQWSPCPIDGRSALDGSCGSSFRMGSSITHVGR